MNLNFIHRQVINIPTDDCWRDGKGLARSADNEMGSRQDYIRSPKAKASTEKRRTELSVAINEDLRCLLNRLHPLTLLLPNAVASAAKRLTNCFPIWGIGRFVGCKQ